MCVKMPKMKIKWNYSCGLRMGYGCSDAPYLHAEALLRTVSVFKKYSPLAGTFPEYLLTAIQDLLLHFSPSVMISRFLYI